MASRTYLKFLIIAVTALLLFSTAGYFFYDYVSDHYIIEVQQEQEMVAERVVENLENYFLRVSQVVDSVLNFVPHSVSDISNMTSRRFRLLWDIYPEITHLIFLNSDNEVYYTGKDGDFLPLGLPLQDVYEWQHFAVDLWRAIDDLKLHQHLTVLMRYVPELDKVMPVPMVIFSKRVVVDGEYAGLILVPYQLDFIFDSYCQNMTLDKRREVVVADSHGEVVFSSLPGLIFTALYPSYGAPAADLLVSKEKQLSWLDKKQTPAVMAALSNQKPFSATLKITPQGKKSVSVTFLASFRILKVITSDWTVMVASPKMKANELAWSLLLPIIVLCVLSLFLVVVISFAMLRRADYFARESAIFKAGLVASVDGVIVLDHKGHYLFANHSYCEITGLSQDDIIGTMFKSDFANVTAKGLPSKIFTHLASRGRWQGVVTYRKVGDMPAFDVSQNFSEIYRDGRKVGYISNLHDISEERRLQREVEVYSEFLNKEVERQTEVIVQTQKMETVGILAAGFAHDFNNLLASMHGNIELLEMIIKSSPEKCGRYIDKIKQASLQAADLTSQILLFSRRDIGGTETLSVIELVESTLALVPPSIPAQIVCDYLEDSDDVNLEVDRSALVQSLLNLILNAGESFSEGQRDARIDIVAKVKFIDRYLGQRFNLVPGKWYCEITISDNGSGIPPAMMKRIFDPFFSTKEWANQKGTGLGLPIAYRTVTNHDGIITVNSEVGVGSSFVVYLPIASGIKKRVSQELVEEVAHDLKSRKILVVDDEELLSDSIKVLLELYGGQVEMAADGREALAILKNSVIDLIILDLLMPGMSGEDFLHEMERLNLKIPVMIMTGTVKEGFRICKLFPVAMEVLEKPFSQKKLLQLCCDLLR